MRRFVVFLDKNSDQSEVVLEFPDRATDRECEDACIKCPQSMMDDELYTGWNEL